MDIFITSFAVKNKETGDIDIANVYVTKNKPETLQEEWQIEERKSIKTLHLTEEWQPNNWHTICFVVKIQNEIVAMAGVGVNRGGNSLPDATLFSGFVTKKHRNQGIYKQLFKARYDYLLQHTHPSIIDIDTLNEYVKKILKSYNFIENGFKITLDACHNVHKSCSYYKAIKYIAFDK